MYLIDTNCFIYLFAKKQPHFKDWLKTIPPHHIFLSPIAYHEAYYWFLERNSQKALNLLKEIETSYNLLAYTFDDTKLAANIRLDVRKNRRQNDTFDTHLAAQAINNNLTLVTFNRKDFEIIPRLRTKFFDYE